MAFFSSDERVGDRRSFLRAGAVAGIAALTAGSVPSLRAEEATELPFDNGERPLVRYPQKRPMLRLTSRPPQLETPFSVYGEGVLTPNDAFFVRYHLALSPPPEASLRPDAFQVTVQGKVQQPLKLSVADLKSQFDAVEVVAVNQCSGNSRGFSQPRVPGGQSGNGAMGNARWRGVRLKDVLNKAGLAAGARQVTFNGLDKPLLPQTPDFVKALDVDHALDGDVMLAYEMNGEELPWLNGYPLRLVVPGHYGTYWIKHLHEITVVDEVYAGYWMSTAYRIPDNACGCLEPGTAPTKTVPIQRFNVRSFITSPAEGSRVSSGEPVTVRGIAFDGGYGIAQVLVSDDGGTTWRQADLGKDLGKYSFREWSLPYVSKRKGTVELLVKATNRLGQSQPMDPLWNPAGYLRNVVERVRLEVL
ncbi:MAG: molybdopterin-dependent oxidoreductase [Verrucomicrobiales bacterium]|nr:molybdopterin-dependent oxidoreductase [Verrucomicrobiales bacterium]